MFLIKKCVCKNKPQKCLFRNRSTPFSTDNFLKNCALALPMRVTSIGMSYLYKKELILGEASRHTERKQVA